jgi:hypothetical protein
VPKKYRIREFWLDEELAREVLSLELSEVKKQFPLSNNNIE